MAASQETVLTTSATQPGLGIQGKSLTFRDLLEQNEELVTELCSRHQVDLDQYLDTILKFNMSFLSYLLHNQKSYPEQDTKDKIKILAMIELLFQNGAKTKTKYVPREENSHFADGIDIYFATDLTFPLFVKYGHAQDLTLPASSYHTLSGCPGGKFLDSLCFERRRSLTAVYQKFLSKGKPFDIKTFAEYFQNCFEFTSDLDRTNLSPSDAAMIPHVAEYLASVPDAQESDYFLEQNKDHYKTYPDNGEDCRSDLWKSLLVYGKIVAAKSQDKDDKILQEEITFLLSKESSLASSAQDQSPSSAPTLVLLSGGSRRAPQAQRAAREENPASGCCRIL